MRGFIFLFFLLCSQSVGAKEVVRVDKVSFVEDRERPDTGLPGLFDSLISEDKEHRCNYKYLSRYEIIYSFIKVNHAKQSSSHSR